MEFSELFDETILRALKQLNFRKPTLVQEKTIPIIFEKKDLIASAQTGTGKTASFALPIVQMLLKKQNSEKRSKKIKALIICPTRELGTQINESFHKIQQFTNLRSTVVFGGVSLKPQQEILAKGIDILIATPGRLIDLYTRKHIDLKQLEILVLDEADLMLDMGFINDIQKIESFCPVKKQTLLFSATMPEKITHLANNILINPKKITIHPESLTSEKVGQLLYKLPKKNKTDLCLHLLRNEIHGKIIIFRRTKFGVEKLTQSLLKNGYKAESIHGDKSQIDRNKAIENFKANKTTILIATDLASRGIHVNKVDAVINFDLPNIPETYIHRIGRTGRAGKSGIALSFCSPDENSYVELIEELSGRTIKEITEHPYPLVKKKKKNTAPSPHKKSRKSANSKKNKKRWY